MNKNELPGYTAEFGKTWKEGLLALDNLDPKKVKSKDSLKEFVRENSFGKSVKDFPIKKSSESDSDSKWSYLHYAILIGGIMGLVIVLFMWSRGGGDRSNNSVAPLDSDDEGDDLL